MTYRYGKRLIASAYNAGKSKIGKVSNVNCIFNEKTLATLIRVFSEELRILKRNENSIPIAEQNVLHVPMLLGTKHQRRCIHCHIHTCWTCSCCQDKTGKPLPICTNGYCNILQHNPHIKLDYS